MDEESIKAMQYELHRLHSSQTQLENSCFYLRNKKDEADRDYAEARENYLAIKAAPVVLIEECARAKTRYTETMVSRLVTTNDLQLQEKELKSLESLIKITERALLKQEIALELKRKVIPFHAKR